MPSSIQGRFTWLLAILQNCACTGIDDESTHNLSFDTTSLNPSICPNTAVPERQSVTPSFRCVQNPSRDDLLRGPSSNYKRPPCCSSCPYKPGSSAFCCCLRPVVDQIQLSSKSNTKGIPLVPSPARLRFSSGNFTITASFGEKNGRLPTRFWYHCRCNEGKQANTPVPYSKSRRMRKLQAASHQMWWEPA